MKKIKNVKKYASKTFNSTSIINVNVLLTIIVKVRNVCLISVYKIVIIQNLHKHVFVTKDLF